MENIDIFLRLGVALAAGILVGIERGWHEREAPEGTRVAGIRTFGIIGLLGGLWAFLAENLGETLLGFAFAAFAIVMLVARGRAVRDLGDYGATTVVASLVTFALGAVAVRGDMEVAAAGAVVTTLLLGIKPFLHSWVERIEYEELLAVLKLLVMSVVLLPVLPDRGFGPWEALNPFRIWLMVVLIASISFAGYVAVKIAGGRRGILLTGLAGGLVSSTAVTLNLSRLARRSPDQGALLASGVALASAMMFPRTLLIAAILEPALLSTLAVPLAAAAAVCFAMGLALVRARGETTTTDEIRFRNPFELMTALQFGVLLAAVLLFARALEAWAGTAGLYALAFVSGVANVDAVTVSYATMVDSGLPIGPAAIGIVIAALANTAFKAGLAFVVGGAAMARPVALVLGAALLGGLAGLGVVLLGIVPG